MIKQWYQNKISLLQNNDSVDGLFTVKSRTVSVDSSQCEDKGNTNSPGDRHICVSLILSLSNIREDFDYTATAENRYGIFNIPTQWMVVTQSCRKSPVSGNKGHKSSNRCIYICILVIKSLTYCVKYENYSAWMLISSIGDHYVPVQPKNKSDNFCGIIWFKIRILNNSISYNWHIVYYKYINMYL